MTFCAHRPRIPKIHPQVERPLWSVMIPSYHCTAYLGEALKSVIAQALPPNEMQIEVVDDCSTDDDPSRVVRSLGQGRVDYYQQPKNVGHVRNFNTCLLRAKGHLIHILHGDDGVRPTFYQKLGEALLQSPETQAAFCRHIIMDERSNWQIITPLEQQTSGLLSDWLRRILIEQRIQPPSMVVRRDFYEKHGGFDERFTCSGEDWEMWIRIATHSPVWYETEPLALYRKHSLSLNRRTERSGENTRDLARVISIVEGSAGKDLARGELRGLLKLARAKVVRRALRHARQMLRADDTIGAINQGREAAKCLPSLSTQIAYQKLRLGVLVKGLRSKLRPLKRRLVGSKSNA